MTLSKLELTSRIYQILENDFTPIYEEGFQISYNGEFSENRFEKLFDQLLDKYSKRRHLNRFVIWSDIKILEIESQQYLVHGADFLSIYVLLVGVLNQYVRLSNKDLRKKLNKAQYLYNTDITKCSVSTKKSDEAYFDLVAKGTNIHKKQLRYVMQKLKATQDKESSIYIQSLYDFKVFLEEEVFLSYCQLSYKKIDPKDDPNMVEYWVK